MSQVAERTHIGAYVDAEQRRQLIELARERDRSVSSVIRLALAEHLEREQTTAASPRGATTSQPSRPAGAPDTDTAA